MDYVAKFHEALRLLHLARDEADRFYIMREVENARQAAKEMGQKASRVLWDSHRRRRPAKGFE